MKKLKLLLVVLSILFVVSVSSCTPESDRAYAEARKCAATITNGGDCSGNQTAGGQQPVRTTSPQPSAKLGEPKDRSIEESRVYLDATESMKGFAVSPNNTFTKIIESLSYAMPGCHLYKYGMTGKKSVASSTSDDFANEIRFSQDLRKPSFYDRGYNEDDVLFDFLATEDPAVRSVLVTDGVYSARDSELQSEVVKAIAKWLKRGRFFGILVFSSPFEGKLYSENKRTWIDVGKVDARPFYAFVFSPDERGFRDLRDKLIGEFKDMQSLVFPREAVFCPLSPVVRQGLEHKEVPPISSYYLHMYNESIFAGTDSVDLAYDFRCLPVPDYPVAEFGIEVEVDAYSWQPDSFKKSESQPKFSFKYSGETAIPSQVNASSPSPAVGPNPAVSPAPPAAATKLGNMRLTFQNDLSSKYGLYQVLFTFSSKALSPGVRSLSTEDDSQISDANKTYRLYEFISALTTVHLRDQRTVKLPPPVFLVLTHK